MGGEADLASQLSISKIVSGTRFFAWSTLTRVTGKSVAAPDSHVGEDRVGKRITHA